MSGSIDRHDEREIYCRRLGHQLSFAYCRSTDADTPCHKILDCWFERFDVAGFLGGSFPREQIDLLTAQPPPKAVSLYDLIMKAKEAARMQGDGRKLTVDS